MHKYNVDQINQQMADSYVIAYTTCNGRICRLVNDKGMWYFINDFNPNHEPRDKYSCKRYNSYKRALKSVITESSTRWAGMFSDDEVYLKWCLKVILNIKRYGKISSIDSSYAFATILPAKSNISKAEEYRAKGYVRIDNNLIARIDVPNWAEVVARNLSADLSTGIRMCVDLGPNDVKKRYVTELSCDKLVVDNDVIKYIPFAGNGYEEYVDI